MTCPICGHEMADHDRSERKACVREARRRTHDVPDEAA